MLSVQVVFKMCVSRVEPSFSLSQRREEIPDPVFKEFKWPVFRGGFVLLSGLFILDIFLKRILAFSLDCQE